MQVDTDAFYKLIVSFLVCVARYAQSTQSKVPIEYLQKNIHEGDILPGNKQKS